MQMYYIYVLRCPDTNDVRYVGCTRWPSHRQREHCVYAINAPKTRLQIWLKELRERNTSPIFEIIESFKSNVFAITERGKEAYWIREYRERGCDLFNVHGNRYRF